MEHERLIWLGICSALVFFMQAGFAFLECGFSRAKNAINVIMKNYTDMCFGGLVYWFVGYGLMFGLSGLGVIGSSQFAPNWDETDTINLLYQLMFASTSATILSGALAERTRYFPYIVCSLLVSGLVYPVFGHWAWNPNGWLKQLGFIDFAGSTVVHSVGGWCSLAGVLIVGPRLGRYSRRGEVRQIPGHNLPFCALGGFILWLGWFGFNGGSVSDFKQLGPTLLNTHLGGCAGIVTVILFLGFTRQPIYTGAVINAGVAGLVSITAGAAYLSPWGAILAGGLGGLFVFLGAEWLKHRGIDDVVDAIAVHGLGGIWGTLAAGLFYADDPFNAFRVSIQLLGILTALAWALPCAWLCFNAVNRHWPLRAESEHERRGLDYTEHFELGYGEAPKTWQPETDRGAYGKE